MKDKYYTPESNEFHIDFEYECKSHSIGKKNEWSKFICGEELVLDNKFLLNQIKNKLVRVKYLNKEDIKELGWKYDRNYIYYLNNYMLHFFSNNILVHIFDDIEDENSTIFLGFIKNKSELQKIMNLINIKTK